MFSKIVIDLKTDQLNESYDYAIPSSLESFVGIGSRVLVPFGFQDVMGYVIDIMEESPYENNIKFIKDVLDYEQELTKEQIELAKYLCETYLVSMSSILDKMIPSFLKGQQRKYMVIEKYALLHPTLALLFEGKERIRMTSKMKEYYPLIKKEMEKGNITLDYECYTYGKGKKQKVYSLPSSSVVFRSQQRKKIIQYLEEHGPSAEEVLLSNLETTANLLHTMVKDQDLVMKEEIKISNPQEEKKNLYSYPFTFDQSQTLLKYDQSKTIPYLLFSNDEKFNLAFYLHIIEENSKQNKATWICCPTVMLEEEVYITLNKMLKGYTIYGYNAKNTKSECYDAFMNIRYQQYDVFVTTMAGILFPISLEEKTLGTIIVLDEDHPNYINENYPYFHMHDIFKWRASYHKSRIIFSSSTPSIETYELVEEGKYNLYTSGNYIKNPVTLVSMKEEKIAFSTNLLSKPLILAMQEAFLHQNQVMLYLNNKSYASILQCKECGKILKCPTCQIPLTFHKEKKVAKCPYCDYKLYQYDVCSCGSHRMLMMNAGLEQLQEELHQYFPNQRILQVDADQMKNNQDYESAISKIEEKEVDIIIGTNVLTKKFQSDSIEVIGLLSIDQLLNSSDYRASEYTYHMIVQNIHRPKVFVQTYYPNHSVIQKAIRGEYESYFEEEKKLRENLLYPPFCELNRLMITGSYQEMYHFANYFKKVFQRIVSGSALGPVYDPKTKGVKLLLKHQDFLKVKKILEDTKDAFRDKNVLVSFERKPKVM